jgi:DNA-binding CsgD family transcriptional regulator
VSALVARRAGGPVDDSVVSALRAALGPLLGNPGSLLSTLDQLRQDGRLVMVQGRLCVQDSVRISLPKEHELVQRVHQLGNTGRDLVAMVASSEMFTVDDLPMFATATGGSLTGYGQAVDRLIAAGVLVCDPAGRVECRCPALAAAILAEMPQESVRRLHRLFAEQALRTRSGLGMAAVALADHIAAAERALPPTAAVVDLLIAEADRVVANEPHRAATWYRAALWHGRNNYPEQPEILDRLLRTLIRAGSYELLEKVVGEVVADDLVDSSSAGARETANGAGLALAAALAALHTGRPVSGLVRTTLASQTGIGPMERANRWLATGDPSELEGFLEDFAALAPQRPTTQDELAEAAAIGDLVTVFELAFGAAYGAARRSPLALYHRMVRAYAAADWTEALSLARQLEMTDQEATAIHWYSRVIATEICTASGHVKQASRWLDDAPREGPAGALRGWSECLLLFSIEGAPAAFNAGWSAYQRMSGDGAPTGWERQLLRLLYIAMVDRDQERMESIAAEIENAQRRAGSRLGREVALLAHGVARRDSESLRASAELVRQRECLPDRVLIYLMVAAVADEPEPWLREAYDLAKYLDLVMLRGWARKLMDERGVAVSGPRSPRKSFSDIELRIIELIGAGRTNRQIALEIRMSVKTVENYLTRLFAKTGCRSRLDLAAASLKGNLTPVGT